MKNAQVLDAECIICREGITNPICPECLAKEIRSWYPRIRIMGTPMSYGEVKCLFCGKRMSICAHCYTRDIYEQLKEEDSILAEEFIEVFDFGLKEDLF